MPAALLTASSGTNSATLSLRVSIAFPVVIPGRSVVSEPWTVTFTSKTFASALGRRPDREPRHHVLHHLQQIALPLEISANLTHLRARLLGLGLVVRPRLGQRAVRPFVVDRGLALHRRRLVDRLLLGETFLLERQLHRANVLACGRQRQGGIEHRLLVLRFRFLEGEAYFVQLVRQGRAVELRDHVALFYDRAFRHDGLDLHLPRARLLRAGRGGDLHELPRPQLAGGGHGDGKRTALDASDEGIIRTCGTPRQQPGAGDENGYTDPDQLPPSGAERPQRCQRGKSKRTHRVTSRESRKLDTIQPFSVPR